MTFWTKLLRRAESLLLTLISKKYFVVLVATFLLFRGLLTGEVWAMFVLAVLGVASWEKVRGVQYDYSGGYYQVPPPKGE